MGNNDLAVRFTENNYSTKSEVSKELKISVIDGVWDKILSYRSPFYHYLSIKGVDKNQLRVCLCPTISNKVNSAETKLIKLLNEFNKLSKENGDSNEFCENQLVKSLQNVAVKNNLVSDEFEVRNLVKGSEGNKDLKNYLEALRYIKRRYVNNVDMDFLSFLYSAVTGNSELTYFYRESDSDDINASIISRVYSSAPHQLIDQMMNGLFNFVERSSLSPLLTALISYYYISFIKPFRNFNDEIAVLFAKSVLAHSSLGEFAVYLPFESLINESSAEMSKRFHEVQVTGDVTYIVTYLLDCVDHYFDRLLDSIVDYSRKTIKNDFFRLDEPTIEQVQSEEKVEAEPVHVETTVEEVIKEEVKPEYVTPFKEEKKVEEHKEVKPVETIKEQPRGLAVSYIPEELDEKSALRLQKHLLELDVRLKKSQAHFYARHCTMGMYYSIEQFRKAERCVYETARTSMDKLVEYGYYEKKQYGKKFVYTPVERK